MAFFADFLRQSGWGISTNNLWGVGGGCRLSRRWGIVAQELKHVILGQSLCFLRDFHLAAANRASPGPAGKLVFHFQPMSIWTNNFNGRHNYSPLWWGKRGWCCYHVVLIRFFLSYTFPYMSVTLSW